MKVLQALQRMKTHVVKITTEATLRDAIDRMDLYQVDGLPVVSTEGQLVGMLTEGDIVRALKHNLSHASAPVADYMARDVVVVSENEELAIAAGLMLEKGFKRLPVLNEQFQVVGTLNRVDILQALMEGDLKL